MARPLQSLRLRQTIVATLRADADLTAIGDPLSDRRPHLRAPLARDAGLAVPSRERRRRRAAAEGHGVRVTVHTFSKAQFDDEVESMNAAVQTSLEDAVLELSPA
jgi:hypothetical protein